MEVSYDNVFSRMLSNLDKVSTLSNAIITRQSQNMSEKLLDNLEKDLNIFCAEVIELINYKPYKAISKLSHAVIVSNKAYARLLQSLKIKHTENGGYVRQNFLQVLNLIDETIEYCEGIRVDLTNDLPITDYKLSTIKFIYNEKIKALELKLSQLNIEPEIFELLLRELRNVIKKKTILRSEMAYLMDLVSNILSSDNLSTEKLEQILIENNFNSRTFLQFCLHKTNALSLEDSSLHQQLDVIISLEERLNNVIQFNKGRRLLSNSKTIAEELRDYYLKKKNLLLQRIDIRRTEMLDSKLYDDNEKIVVNLSVAKLGFLIRLFIEEGYLPQDNIGKTFSFFAKNFRTPNAVFISAESLQKKSSAVEFQTVIKTKGILLDMVNYVNKHHNASHYSQK